MQLGKLDEHEMQGLNGLPRLRCSLRLSRSCVTLHFFGFSADFARSTLRLGVPKNGAPKNGQVRILLSTAYQCIHGDSTVH